MTPQQNTDAKEQSSVYVQKPSGETLNVPVSSEAEHEAKKKDAGQTASNTPTTHSHEITDGEDA